MIRAPRPLRTLPLLAVAILAGCSDRRAAEAAGAAVAAAAPRFEIQDSAGIPIVVNAEPGPHMPRFQLAQPAAATIGVVEGAPEYQLFRVGSGVVLADGTIVIANVGTMELRFYDGTGTYLRSAGRRGQGPGELMNLRIVGAFADDSILVWDFNQTRFSVFDREGAFGRSYSIQATPFLPPIPQGVLSDGRAVTTELPPPQQGPRTGIVRPAETVGVTSADGHARDILGAFPSTELSYVGAPRGQMDGIPLTFARTLHVAARGDRILVGTSDGYRIAVYDLNGGLARVVRQRRTPVPVAEEDYERGLLPAHRAGGARRAQLEPHLEQMKYHTTLPAFGADAPLPSFRITRSGSFWVREYTPRWIEGSTWQLFDTEGVFKGRLELPPRFDVLDMGDDWVLARAFDDLDVERVVLHRIERMPAPR